MNKKPIPLFWRKWRQHRASIVVWLMAVAATAVLFHWRSQQVELMGLVQGQQVQIMSSRTARIKQLAVTLMDHVEKDDVMAILEDEQPRESLQVALAEIDKLQSELIALSTELDQQAVGQAQEWLASKRRLDIDVDSARLRMLELKAVLEPDRVKLRQMMLQIQAAQDLATQGLLASLDLQKTRSDFDGLNQKIRENERLLIQVERDLTMAQQRREALTATRPQIAPESEYDRLLTVTRKAIRVQELKVEALKQEQAALVLTAPISGQVTNIHKTMGEVALPGESLLVISQPTANHIVTYLPDSAVSALEQGNKVKLLVRRSTSQTAFGQVVAVSNQVTLVPVRLRADPRLETWGRQVMIDIPQSLKLVPGELVGIKKF